MDFDFARPVCYNATMSMNQSPTEPFESVRRADRETGAFISDGLKVHFQQRNRDGTGGPYARIALPALKPGSRPFQWGTSPNTSGVYCTPRPSGAWVMHYRSLEGLPAFFDGSRIPELTAVLASGLTRSSRLPLFRWSWRQTQASVGRWAKPVRESVGRDHDASSAFPMNPGRVELSGFSTAKSMSWLGFSLRNYPAYD